jgi:hypothetical protein
MEDYTCTQKVFEKKVLKRMFRPNMDEILGGWRKLHNEELHNLYSSPNINRIIKSRRMRWAGHVALLEENMNVYRYNYCVSEHIRHLVSI